LGYPHPDFLFRVLNYRQLAEWAAFERISPFEPERADARQSLHTFWMRETWIEKHNAKPSDYALDLDGKPAQTEADVLFGEIADLFDLR